jgi:hypothetical protein
VLGTHHAGKRTVLVGGARAGRGAAVILVDTARWPWRGRLWAHLASDEAPSELHAFAARLGLRRTSYQGDHYDVDEDGRRRALALGAAPVPSRELVRRLQVAGLRRRGPRAALAWRELAVAPVERPERLRAALVEALHPSRRDEGEAALRRLAAAASPAGGAPPSARLGLLERPGELALVVLAGPRAWPPWHEVVVDAPRDAR